MGQLHSPLVGLLFSQDVLRFSPNERDHIIDYLATPAEIICDFRWRGAITEVHLKNNEGARMRIKSTP